MLKWRTSNQEPTRRRAKKDFPPGREFRGNSRNMPVCRGFSVMQTSKRPYKRPFGRPDKETLEKLKGRNSETLKSQQMLVSRLGRTLNAIRFRREKFRIPPCNPDYRLWTPEEEKLLGTPVIAGNWASAPCVKRKWFQSGGCRKVMFLG